ncbi:MAG: hypothetical protein IIZ74_06750 [Erysipelotrichaceae bacterium]|nr:hypothetical protein [Erysipelotrichaceae bacterium]
MNVIEAIKHRRSVRSFDGRQLTEEEKNSLSDFFARADNPYGQDIEWVILDAEEHDLSSPVITGCKNYLAGKMKRQAHSEEAFGYSFEKIVLQAEAMGLGTTWIAGTMDRKAFEKAVGLEEGQVMPCISPIGHPAEKMSFRETMMRKGVKADSRYPFDKLFYLNSFDQPLNKEKAGKLTIALEMVQTAPSAVNKQPWRLVVCGDTVHFYQSVNGKLDDGSWDIQKIDMGIALCHFDLAVTYSGFNTEFIIDDPGIEAEGNRYIASIKVTE